MGSINIDFIKKDTTTQDSHLYSDLHLDLDNDYKVKGNFDKSSTRLIDIKIAYDIEAVKNSLTAIFSTYPGQRLLIPEFGVNIKRFLFAPVSETNALAIGELMNEAIERWEPRVLIQSLNITPKIDAHQYDITLDFYIPSLRTGANFFGSILHGEGFTTG